LQRTLSGLSGRYFLLQIKSRAGAQLFEILLYVFVAYLLLFGGIHDKEGMMIGLENL